MSASIRSLLVVALLVGAAPARAQELFVGDFEDGSLEGWRTELCCDHSVRVVEEAARRGRYAARFELHRDDPDVSSSRRAELLPPRHDDVGGEYWYGFATMLGPDWERDASPEIVAQWHGYPDFDDGETWRSPPLSLIVRDDRYILQIRWDPKRVTSGNDPRPEGDVEDIDLGEIAPGEWTDWVFHVRWSYASDGVLEVWRDGERVHVREAPNCYNDARGPYFKIGIYKWDWKSRPERSTTSQRVLFHDEVRIFGEAASYEDVAPGGVETPPDAGPPADASAPTRDASVRDAGAPRDGGRSLDGGPSMPAPDLRDPSLIEGGCSAAGGGSPAGMLPLILVLLLVRCRCSVARRHACSPAPLGRPLHRA